MILTKLKDFFRTISIDCIVTCIYFLCIPFTVVTTPFGSLLKIITMPVTVILIYKLFFGNRKPLRFNSVQFTYALYIVFTLCGLFFLIDEYSVILTKDMVLTFAVMMLITVRVYNDREKELMESVWILVGVVCTYLCLTSTSVANEFENRTIVYVLGFREDPNQFCAYFIMPVMICIKRIVQRRRLMPFYIVLLVLILYSVLRTGSRGGLIGIIVGIVFCIILAVRSLKATVGLLLVGTLCAVVVVGMIFPLLPEDVQARYSVQRVIEEKGTGRFDIWKYLIDYTAENPARLIRGSGMYSTYPILEKGNVAENVGVAHNQFVQTLTDQGIIGTLLFIAVILVCVFRNWRKNPYYTCAFISVMAFSMSLTLYVFKPYINIIIMCAMNFEAINQIHISKKGVENETVSKDYGENQAKII